MRAVLRNVVGFVAGAVVACGALGAPLLPGGTLDPIPAVRTPPGGVVLYTNSYPFNITHNVPPFNNCSGTLEQRVSRQTDGTLVFRYQVFLNTICLPLDRFTVSNFANFSTDLTINSLGLISDGLPSSATRSSPTGATIFVNFDNGVDPGFQSRPLYIETNATDFDLTGTATARITSGASTFTSSTLTGLARPIAGPPTVEITAPDAFGCSCNPTTIIGTVTDPLGINHYFLEYSSGSNGPWSFIAQGNSAVNNGALGSWNTTSVAQGHYFVRLTAINNAGKSATATTVLFVDKQFDDLEVRLPHEGEVYAGNVCFDGTAWDTCFSRYFVEYDTGGGVFAPVQSGVPFYTTAVINDPLASWSTDTGPTAVPDGAYQVRVRAVDQCNPVVQEVRNIIVDNTVPVARITAPLACTTVDGVVRVTGTAFDANLERWTLQYAGASAHQWVTIASGNTNVVEDVLALWDTSDLRPCPYALRLIVTDSASINCSPFRHQSEYVTVVNVGCEADYDGNGIADIFDLLAFLDEWFAGC